MTELAKLLANYRKALLEEEGAERIPLSIAPTVPVYEAWQELEKYLRVNDPAETRGDG